VNGRKNAQGRADTLRNLLYGQASLDDWADQGAGNPEEPWTSFERARLLILTRNPGQALSIWRDIAFTDGLSSRQALQAWHFMRQAGSPPPAEIAKPVLGATAEVPMHGSHDILAAYKDGTANYLNYSGRATTCDDPPAAHMQAAVRRWLATAQVIADTIGPWEKPSLPPLAAGHARVAALTASGPHFGQGPAAQLSANPLAGTFLGAATSVMQLMVDNAV
jgi:hypothetical protein